MRRRTFTFWIDRMVEQREAGAPLATRLFFLRCALIEMGFLPRNEGPF